MAALRSGWSILKYLEVILLVSWDNQKRNLFVILIMILLLMSSSTGF